MKHDDCSIKDDLQPVVDKMIAADAIVIASPVYFSSATALVRALLERAGLMSRGRFAGKVGGPLVVARRAGQNFTFAEMIFWFHLMQIINPGGTYWNMGIAWDKGEIEKDAEGMMTAWNFGKNLAGLAKVLANSSYKPVQRFRK
jgi:multimeric flavodoxin WrbA